MSDKYIEKQKLGEDVLRWNTNKKYTLKEREEQWREAEAHIKEGKPICLTDLLINGGH